MSAPGLQSREAILERNAARARMALARKRAGEEARAFRASRRGQLLMAAFTLAVGALGFVYACQNSGNGWVRAIGLLLPAAIAFAAVYLIAWLVSWFRAPYLLLRDKEVECATEKKARETADRERREMEDQLRQAEEISNGLKTKQADQYASKVELSKALAMIASENDRLRRALDVRTPEQLLFALVAALDGINREMEATKECSLDDVVKYGERIKAVLEARLTPSFFKRRGAELDDALAKALTLAAEALPSTPIAPMTALRSVQRWLETNRRMWGVQELTLRPREG